MRECLEFMAYDDNCDPEYVTYFYFLEDAVSFARLNACAVVNIFTGQMYCDYREDGDD